ncbi:ACT domain-containing protein [Streptacidiphilus rugosus]|uniref:hypothetical protein n=1 Tax=Streptacidiphilus rugosus TaxID=405783 RepID=UPI0005637072|nr:hypothetical protein [Streptacidiphilus rugosus]
MPVDTPVAPPTALLAADLLPAPAPQQHIVATVLPARGLLARVAAVLSAHRVTALSYHAAPDGPTTVEVTVAAPDATRVRAKLARMVDVLEVLDAG